MAAAASLCAGEQSAGRILIIDDSAVARAVMARLIDASGRFAVAAAVPHMGAAREVLQRMRIDIIILDLALPGMDGLTALPELRAAGAQVLVVSSSTTQGAAATVKALALGAADTLVKPCAPALSGRFGADLLDRLDRLIAGGSGADPAPIATPASPAAAVAPLRELDIVAVGASTGGMHALTAMFRLLPSSFQLPILITQHLPESFMPYFAAQLAVIAQRPCEVATDRKRLQAGQMLVAPGDAHVRCVALGDGEAAVRLSRDPAPSGCMPSVDPMLSSVAEVFGARTLAIVLSGMGRDGAQGARIVHQRGGTVLVQDRASSVVWGMPGVIAEQNLADAVLPPEAIGALLAEYRA